MNMQTFKPELIDRNVSDFGHVTEYGKDDKAGQQAGGQVDGARQQGVTTWVHTHTQTKRRRKKVRREDYYGFVDLIGRVGSHSIENFSMKGFPIQVVV